MTADNIRPSVAENIGSDSIDRSTIHCAHKIQIAQPIIDLYKPIQHFLTTMSTFKNVPSEFICPLSMQVMIQPLVSRSGIHFERAAILTWLAEGSGACPMTGESLRPSDLVPDKRLEARLKFWRDENGVVLNRSLTDKKDVFIGIAALGERPTMTADKKISRGFFPRVNKLMSILA